MNGSGFKEHIEEAHGFGKARVLAAVREVVSPKKGKEYLGKNVMIIDTFTDGCVMSKDGKQMTYDEIAEAGNTIWITDTPLKEGDNWQAI